MVASSDSLYGWSLHPLILSKIYLACLSLALCIKNAHSRSCCMHLGAVELLPFWLFVFQGRLGGVRRLPDASVRCVVRLPPC